MTSTTKNPFQLIALVPITLTYLFAQKEITLDLPDLQSQNKLTIINRDVSVGQEENRRFVKIEKELRPSQILRRGESGVSWLALIVNGVLPTFRPLN